MLMECLIYMGVFVIILAGAMATFYYCWDNSKAMVYTTDDITQVLRAGERWRADVRGATGKISVTTTSDGEQVRIPLGAKEIRYDFSHGELRRELWPAQVSRQLLAKVRSSAVSAATRSGVTAWRWELELVPRRKETQFPLLFTFEAATSTP